MTFGRWMVSAVILTLAALLAAEPVPTTVPASTPTTVSAADIAALVKELGSDSYKTRQHAQDELVKLDLAAKPALEQAAAASDSPEVRVRAAEALRQINDNQPLAPTYVNIHATNDNPNVVFAEFARQTKVPLTLWPPQLWNGQMGPVPSITLHLDHVAFWPAMLQFCKVVDMHPDEMNAGITLMQGGQNVNGAVFQQDLFTFVAREMVHHRGVNFGDKSTTSVDQISMTVLLDPKSRIVHYALPRLTLAVDENNTSLLPTQVPPAGGTQVLVQQSGSWKIDTQIQLDYPEKLGTKLAHLKGVLPVCLVTKTKTLRIEDLAKAVGKSTADGGWKFEVKSFSFADGIGQLEGVISTTDAVRTQYQDLWRAGEQIKILDADGNALVPNGGGGGGSDHRIDRTWPGLHVQDGKQAKPPFSLVWEVVTATRDEDIAFEFNDLPLPPK